MIRLWQNSSDKTVRVMTRRQVRAFDAWAIESMHIPGVVLMENAGRSCAEVLLGELAGLPAPCVTLFCGSGNNGGDGFVMARHLVGLGIRVRIILCAAREKIRGDALINLEAAQAMNIPMQLADLSSSTVGDEIQAAARRADWLVDAFLGTGLQGPLTDPAIGLITSINRAGKPVLAVDIPSGMDCDLGTALPVCIQATKTVTLAAVKKGLAENPDARKAAGEIYVASIGIPADLFSA